MITKIIEISKIAILNTFITTKLFNKYKYNKTIIIYK